MLIKNFSVYLKGKTDFSKQDELFRLRKSEISQLNCDKVSFTKTQEKCAFCNGIMLSEVEIDQKIQYLLPLKAKQLNKELNLLSELLYPQAKSLLLKDKYNAILKRRICILDKIKKLASNNSDKNLIELINLLKKNIKLSPHSLNEKTERKILKYIYLPLLKSIDHLTPKIKGGNDCQKNLRTVCQGCNWHKSDKTFEEFAIQYPEILGITKYTETSLFPKNITSAY